MRDYLGRNLCTPCWNGNHYLTRHTAEGKKTSTKIANCERILEDGTTRCDCQCRALLAEQEAKRKQFWEKYRLQVAEAEASRQEKFK